MIEQNTLVAVALCAVKTVVEKGSTASTYTGSLVTQPRPGFVVALGNPYNTKVHHVGDSRMIYPWLLAFALEHKDSLDDAGRYLGTWLDDDYTLHIDVVEIIEDRDTAVSLGSLRNQIAIYDLLTGDEIPCGGTG